MKWLKNLFKRETTNNAQPPEPKKSTVDIDAIIANAPKFEVIEGEPDELNAYPRIYDYFLEVYNKHREDMTYEQGRVIAASICCIRDKIFQILQTHRLSAMTDRELLMEIAMNQKEN